jgi:hypothetical protein
VYEKRRWTRDATPVARSLRAIAAPVYTVCPACRQAAEGQFGGEVRVSGSFFIQHRAEIGQLLKREAERAAEDNPMAVILEWRQAGPGGLIVRTTTEHLAKRLGQALHKAYRGTVHYEFSHENKFAHVTWMREAASASGPAAARTPDVGKTVKTATKTLIASKRQAAAQGQTAPKSQPVTRRM